MKIASKVALVTGGVRGLGAAAAICLAERGGRVTIADIDDVSESDSPGLADVIRGSRRLDVRRLPEWREVLDDIVREEGSLDILHLNAGVVARPFNVDLFDDPLSWFDERTADRILAVNVQGVVNGIIAGLPHLRVSRGTIVITGSIAGVRGFAADPLYCMSKHAVVGLAKALAPRLETEGITINVVCPGGVDTRLVSPFQRRTATLSSPQHVAKVICKTIEQGGTGGIWLVPVDGSVRRFDVDPIAHTDDQSSAQRGAATDTR